MTFAFADLSLAQALLVAAVAFAASILGGLAGYGTGLVLPVVLAPVIGVANVVPVMALAMLINNASRIAAFRHDIAWPHVRRVLWLALPLNIAAAWGYTRLDTRTIAAMLGLFLLASLPLRAWLRRRRSLGPRGEWLAGGVFGFINGGMSGTGVILISTLMAAGVAGPALIATDAVISVVLEVAKVAVFGGLARLDGSLAIAGLLVGLCTTPGAFVARRLLDAIPEHVHARIMEAVVVVGACGFLWRAWA
jgi:uncharacterized membrane protein YfcA